MNCRNTELISEHKGNKHCLEPLVGLILLINSNPRHQPDQRNGILSLKFLKQVESFNCSNFYCLLAGRVEFFGFIHPDLRGA